MALKSIGIWAKSIGICHLLTLLHMCRWTVIILLVFYRSRLLVYLLYRFVCFIRSASIIVRYCLLGKLERKEKLVIIALFRWYSFYGFLYIGCSLLNLLLLSYSFCDYTYKWYRNVYSMHKYTSRKAQGIWLKKILWFFQRTAFKSVFFFEI